MLKEFRDSEDDVKMIGGEMLNRMGESSDDERHEEHQTREW